MVKRRTGLAGGYLERAFTARSGQVRRRRGGIRWLNRMVLMALAGLLLARWLRERAEQSGPPPVMEDESIQIDRYAPPTRMPASPVPPIEELRAPAGTASHPLEEVVGGEPIPDEQAVEPASPATPAQRDDLKVLEGIGPKISELLGGAGILTYRQLAETEVSRLEEILRSAGLRLADPGTWPEQARLLADGQKKEFRDLIDQLKAGRRA